MRKINIQSPPYKLSNEKYTERSQDVFSSVDGLLSFYSKKSFLRTPLLENITIKGFLKEDGEINIYLHEKDLINIPSDIRENFKFKYGLDSILFPGTLFFKGSLMEGFSYANLSQEISTFIVNGNIVSLKKVERATSIGKLKRIEDIIHLNSSFSIMSKNEELVKIKKYSKLNLEIDISIQFKRGAA